MELVNETSENVTLASERLVSLRGDKHYTRFNT